MPTEYSISTRGESYDEAYFESLSKSAEEPEDPGGLDMIKLPWKRGASPLGPRPAVNPKLIELETAKQILEEIYIIYRYLGCRKFDPSYVFSSSQSASVNDFVMSSATSSKRIIARNIGNRYWF